MVQTNELLLQQVECLAHCGSSREDEPGACDTLGCLEGGADAGQEGQECGQERVEREEHFRQNEEQRAKP